MLYRDHVGFREYIGIIFLYSLRITRNFRALGLGVQGLGLRVVSLAK